MSSLLLYGAAAVGVAGAGALALIRYNVNKMSRCKVRDDLKYKQLNDSELQSQLKGKTAFIVGGTKGIGAAIAVELAKKGANVVISGRSDANNLIDKLKGLSPQGKFEFLKADVGRVQGAIDAAQSFMAKYKRVDYLILSVGILSQAQRFETADGLEEDWAVSYFSRYVILQQMKEYLKKQGGESARVYIYGFPGVNQQLHYPDDPQWKTSKYVQMDAHTNTVVYNEALVGQFAKEAPEVAVFGLNPGLISTDIRRNLVGNGFIGNAVEGFVSFIGRQMDPYVATVLQVLASPELGVKASGALFNTYGEAIHANPLLSDEERKQMAAYSESLYQSFVKKNN